MITKLKNIIKKIKDAFSFETGIDITNDTQVLYRRNLVIKNIIFLSNIIYTIIMFIISFSSNSPSNIIVTIILFPLTYLMNKTTKNMINKDSNSYIKQEIAMYFQSFYMFLSAILIYIKIVIDPNINYLREPGYLLIFYALVVISLYQNKKMVKNLFAWLFVSIFIMHFTVTHQIYNKEYATDTSRLTEFFFTKEFQDIFLRTMILIIFMIVLYSIIQIGEYIQDKRKEELRKRRDIQKDFSLIVTNLFKVVLQDNNQVTDVLKKELIVSDIVNKFVNLIDFKDKEYIINYSKIHLNQEEFIKNLVSWDKEEFNEQDFDTLKKETTKGSLIVERLQLSKKANDIVRAHVEGYNTIEFMNNIREVQNGFKSQIILICDIYVILRSAQSYKRPYPHMKTIELLKDDFSSYFNREIFIEFIKLNKYFENIYNEA